MNESNQGNNPDASAIVPVKRRRGRPRKYPKTDLDRVGNVQVLRDQNLIRGENAQVPPGFGRANGDQPHQLNPVNYINEMMVGQAVHGVVEAAFDAGYLLTVRVGNSETTMRGVVFKPGHYVPVSDDNDVAPGVQMIRRNEIRLPRENTLFRGSYSRSRGRNGTAHTFRASYSVAPNDKQTPSTVTQMASPLISRGHIVPVILQPANLSNGVPTGSGEMPSGAVSAPHLLASKGKQLVDSSHPLNGSAHTNQVLDQQSQNNQQMMHSGMQSETGGSNQNVAEELNEVDTKTEKVQNMPFEKLLAEVINRTQVPSQPTEPNSNSNSSGKLNVNDSGLASEDDVSDTDQPLTVEPLQVLQPDVHIHPITAVPRPMGDYRTGKMTELLRVLQENMMENQATSAEEQASSRKRELDEPGSPETAGDDDDDHSKKRSRLSSA